MNPTALDQAFLAVLESLASSLAVQSEKIKQGGSSWIKLADDKSIDGFDFEGITALFSRDGTGQLYIDACDFSRSNSARLAQLAKFQGDILSAMERDSRERYRTRVRSLAHATARLKTHGLGRGPIHGGIIQWARLLIQPE